MNKRLINDLTIGIQTYYNVTEEVAIKVARKITPWVIEQMTAAGVSIPRGEDAGDERYSLLTARLVESEVTAARVDKEK